MGDDGWEVGATQYNLFVVEGAVLARPRGYISRYALRLLVNVEHR